MRRTRTSRTSALVTRTAGLGCGEKPDHGVCVCEWRAAVAPLTERPGFPHTGIGAVSHEKPGPATHEAGGESRDAVTVGRHHELQLFLGGRRRVAPQCRAISSRRPWDRSPAPTTVMTCRTTPKNDKGCSASSWVQARASADKSSARRCSNCSACESAGSTGHSRRSAWQTSQSGSWPRCGDAGRRQSWQRSARTTPWRGQVLASARRQRRR